MSVRSRVTDIRNRFEGVPVTAPRERFVSGVDAGPAVVSREARIASMRSAEKTEAAAGGAPARRRRVPAVVPGDTDELRAMKKLAAEKEKEIQALAQRICTLNERLGRVTSLLDASASAPVVATSSTGNRIQSAEFQGGAAADVKKLVESSRGAGGIPSAANKKKKGAAAAGSSNSNSLESILAAARSAPKAKAPPAKTPETETTTQSTANATDNSLEAILAAARGGKATGGAKFSKMIRDMK